MTDKTRARLQGLVEEWKECEMNESYLPATRATFRQCRHELTRQLDKGPREIRRYSIRYGGAQLPPVEQIDPDGPYVRYADLAACLAAEGEADPLKPIIDDMQACSDAADEACGTSGYQVALVSLALVARHYLRERAASPASPEGE